MQELQYGTHPEQFFRIHVPINSSHSTFPVIFLIHGGYWKQCYNLDNSLIDSIPPYFASQGFWCVHLEYRRGCEKDNGAGGWPVTNADILLALTVLMGLPQSDPKFQSMDISKIVIIGHSAGGTLALWPCSSLDTVFEDSASFCLPLKLPVQPLLCVAIAPIGDLVPGYERRLSDDGDAVLLYMKCSPTYNSDNGQLSETCPYRLASPRHLLPLLTKTIVVAGDCDDVVPLYLIQDYHAIAVEQAKQHGTPVPELLLCEGADHSQLVDPESTCWPRIFDAIKKYL
jgi:acetyl esterase/lipase